MQPALRRYLLSLQASGVRRIPRGVPVARTAAVPLPTGAPGTAAGADSDAAHTGALPADAAPADVADLFVADRIGPRGDADQVVAALAALAEEVGGCTACKLSEARHLAVPGEGHPRPDVVFVGEGPGADEDRTGRPFVGRAGQLLDDIITKGMRRRREDVYICNVVKCRPPGNRVPESDEREACGSFLDRQLELLAPKVICTLGATAARHLLETDLPMSRLRGGTYEYRGIPVIPTYHPAYLLRNAAAKKPCWEDIQRVMAITDPS